VHDDSGPTDLVAGTGTPPSAPGGRRRPASWRGPVAPRSPDARRGPAAWRRPAGITVGAAGVALYNWWVVVGLHSHLMTSPDELFSDLEATGRPDASLLQGLDLAAGLVLIAALLLRGREGPDGARAEWPWLVGFATAGAVGGHFAYACPEGISASCRSAEWRLALPPHHYVHVLAGIVEFATATVAVYLAWQRTRAVERPTTRAVRWTGRTLVAAYPLLGLAYLTDRMGAFVEPVFFLSFSVMVLVELAEPVPGGTRATGAPRTAPAQAGAGSGSGGHTPRRPLDGPPAGTEGPVIPTGTPGPRAVTCSARRGSGHRSGG